MSAHAAITVVAEWLVRSGEEAQVVALMRDVAVKSRAEAGCLEYRVNRSRDDPRSIVVFERYADQPALDAHRASAHFRDVVLKEIVPKLERRSSRLFEELA